MFFSCHFLSFPFFSMELYHWFSPTNRPQRQIYNVCWKTLSISRIGQPIRNKQWRAFTLELFNNFQSSNHNDFRKWIDWTTIDECHSNISFKKRWKKKLLPKKHTNRRDMHRMFVLMIGFDNDLCTCVVINHWLICDCREYARCEWAKSVPS